MKKYNESYLIICKCWEISFRHVSCGFHTSIAWHGHEESRIQIQTYSMKILYSNNKNCTNLTKTRKENLIEHFKSKQQNLPYH